MIYEGKLNCPVLLYKKVSPKLKPMICGLDKFKNFQYSKGILCMVSLNVSVFWPCVPS